MRHQSKMQTDCFKRLQAIFNAALERDEDARTAFVRDVCGEDCDLADEVLALLRYEAQAAAAKTARPFALAAVAFDVAEAGSLIGQIVGRYRLEAQIGSGGMGRVFKARRVDGDVEQTVALKLIRRELFNEGLLKRFSDERRILASLNHPGIAHLIDAGTDAHGSPFVAMEYVDGMPLIEYCARHSLSIRDRLLLFRHILDAVAHAHRNLVAHCDLKPDNVLVTADNHVKLLDFGIAKALGSGPQRTATAERFFTPAYAAPEQLSGEPATVVCDVYALGAILYELLSGAPVFEASEARAGELERMILAVPPEPLRTAMEARGTSALRRQGVVDLARWAHGLQGDLENIVQKALRKEPQSRYAGVEPFDGDIAAYLDQRPVAASGTAWLYRTRKFGERNAIAIAFSALAVLATALGIGRIMMQNSEIRLERDRARIALNILQNSFQSADPARLTSYSPDVGSDDPRMREVLASAAREIDALQQTQPALFRDLAYRIGEIQLNLGNASAGLYLIRRANASTADPTDTGILLEIRGLIMGNKLEKARILIESNRTGLAANPEFSAENAHLLYLEKHYDDAIAICERLLSAPAGEMASALRDRAYWYLAEAYNLSGRYQDAVRVLDRQIAEQHKRNGRDDPMTLVSRLRRAELLSKTGNAASAERDLMAISPLLDRHYGRGSAVYGQYQNIFGQVMNAQGRSEEAISHFRESLAAQEAAFGSEHENTLRAHFNVAQMIAYSMPDRSAAYPHFAEAIAGIEKTKGPAYSLIGFFRVEAAKAYYWDKDKESARRILTPPNALLYFPEMPPQNQALYLSALYYGFGPQDCSQGWEKTVLAESRPDKIARTLMCRYDPKHKNIPTD
jgi:eukaryotic-like serine/threonine-protein kinase